MLNRQMRDMVVSNYLQLRAPVLLLDLDEDGRIVETNLHARALLGSDCVGRHFSEIIIDFHQRFNLAELRSHSTGELFSYKTASGIPVSLKTRYLPLGTGGLVAGEYDLEETGELQTTLVRLNSELNTISRDLQKKTAQLQQANNLKNQFLGIAAHDLRNPLATIYTYIDLLKDDCQEDDQKKLLRPLEEIQNEVTYMLNLVSNLLDFSVIEQGQLSLHRQAVDLRQLLSQAVESNRLLSARRGIDIRLQMAEASLEVMIDLHKIRQVVNNLVANAVKFSPDGAVVTVSATHDDAICSVAVTDKGPGIPPEKQDLLFQPFGRTGQHSLSGEQNIGLGLAICRKMVEAHGGTIAVDSVPGSGSRFWFSMPIQ